MRTPNASLIISSVLLATLTACQSGISSGLPGASSAASGAAENAASAGHLYVAIVSSSRKLSIERYRLHEGIPATDPDLVYDGYSGLIAVAGDGTLYSTLAQSPVVVDVFPPGSNKPARKINVRPACNFSSSGFNVVNAIATDPSGYLFVLIYSYPGSASVREPEAKTPCNGVAVYAPNANGRARPVQMIRIRNTAAAYGLAVDANDNLYVGENYPSVVKEYSNAVGDPKRTRTFSGKYFGTIRSVATDSAGNLFIGNALQSYSKGWINRYSPTAKGGGPPTSTIYLQGSGPHLLYSMAVRGRYLYLDDSQQFTNPQSVGLYYALHNGTQSPFYSLQEPKVDSVAVGP